jgi:nicotinate-nucleotide pyrophosphorylase (carboxylating)
MLDNFDVQQTAEAVQLNANRVKLEASGNMDLDRIAELIGVLPDYVSVGKLTKDVASLDLSLRLVGQEQPDGI